MDEMEQFITLKSLKISNLFSVVFFNIITKDNLQMINNKVF